MARGIGADDMYRIGNPHSAFHYDKTPTIRRGFQFHMLILLAYLLFRSRVAGWADISELDLANTSIGYVRADTILCESCLQIEVLGRPLGSFADKICIFAY